MLLIYHKLRVLSMDQFRFCLIREDISMIYMKHAKIYYSKLGTFYRICLFNFWCLRAWNAHTIMTSGKNTTLKFENFVIQVVLSGTKAWMVLTGWCGCCSINKWPLRFSWDNIDSKPINTFQTSLYCLAISTRYVQLILCATRFPVRDM